MSVKSRRRQALTVGPVAALAIVLAGCGDSSGGGGGGADGNVFRRPVDLVVPFGPGGGADQVARAAASSMEKHRRPADPGGERAGRDGKHRHDQDAVRTAG